MRIDRLLWNDYRIMHIAEHGVEPEEVWEVCEDESHRAQREGQNRYRLYGQTTDGRYLFVIIEHVARSIYRPITARDMTPREKQLFKRVRS